MKSNDPHIPDMTSPDNDPILNSSDVAQLLGISIPTARAWLQDKAGSDVWTTPGGHRRIRASALKKLTERQSIAIKNLDEQHVFEECAQEEARLAAVTMSKLTQHRDSPELNRLVWLAAEITSCPISLLTLLTRNEQKIIAKHGLDITETPREWAFCNHTIGQDELFMVTDASSDARFSRNPLVTGKSHFRYYAGYPLRNRDGVALGALCVIDTEPRILRANERRALHELAEVASFTIQNIEPKSAEDQGA